MSKMTPRIHSGVTLHKIEAVNVLGAAWKQLQAAVARGAGTAKRQLGDRSGSSERPLYVREDLGIWMSKEKLIDRGYFWLPFGTLPMKPRGNLNMVVQLDRPKTLGAPRVAGLLAEDDQRDRWICHTGRVGGGGIGIGRSTFLAWTPRPAVTVVDGDGQTDVALPIAKLGDSRMDFAIAEFVHEVARFKKTPSEQPREDSVTFGGNARELEGSTLVAARQGYEMTRTHATVRNRLAELLEVTGLSVGRDQQRDLFVGDPENPDFEFEIKPCADTQSFYTAVGQLMVHGLANPAKHRVAVLPHTVDASKVAALGQLGIDLVTFELSSDRIKFENLSVLVPDARQSARLT
jgi:hypothetical protein